MSTTPIPDSLRQRTASVLFVAQSFFSASTIAAFTLSPIIVAELSGTEATAGWPNTIGLIGRAAFAYPFGRMLDQVGRRLSLSFGYSLAVIGAAISALSIFNNNFIGFIFGAMLLGMARASGDQSRYVAAEVYPLARRARIIGLIVFAGTIGAVLGPRLVPISGAWMAARGISEYVGPFVIAGLLTFAGTLIVFLLLRPDPKDIGEQVAIEEAALHPESIDNIVADRRPLREIFTAPMVQLAILSMTIGYFVMAFLMVITPLHMSHHAHNTTNISNVIMLHTLGMFGLAPLTGWLIDRIGRIAVILSGSGILIASCILAPLSLRVPVLGLALFLLGLGWNFCYVAGSSLLLNALAAHERGRAQGASEAIVAVGAGSASLSVGIVFAGTGYLGVSVVGLVASVLMIAATLWLVSRDRKLAQATAAA